MKKKLLKRSGLLVMQMKHDFLSRAQRVTLLILETKRGRAVGRKKCFWVVFFPNVHEIKCILTNLHSYTNNKNVIYFNDFFIFADSK